jgi:Fe-S cluster biogenesis protein NfuA
MDVKQYWGDPIEDVPPANGASETERMAALVEALSSYIEYYHGGSAQFVDFDGDTVYVRLGGACEGCEMSAVTLNGWIEGSLRQFFPQIEAVVAVA